ncbi:MAG: DUF192 domain-containing protein [Chloroflexi bacterium]|nr:DUF192 domain-containing protein [Chloroflexota bacterium]
MRTKAPPRLARRPYGRSLTDLAISIAMRLVKHAPLAVLLFSLACQGAAAPTPTPPATATIVTTPPTATPSTVPTPSAPQVVLNGVTFEVELAITPQERALGLMGRQSLGNRQGMLFIFEGDTVTSFWMRGMLIPLDIVWLDADGMVVGVAANVPPAAGGVQPPLYYPPQPVRYVLEVNAGTAKELNIEVGSRASLLGVPSSRHS